MKLQRMLCELDGVERTFSAPYFHEVVVSLDTPVKGVLETLSKQDILGGFDLSTDFPELGNALLVCATETKTDADLQTLREALAGALAG